MIHRLPAVRLTVDDKAGALHGTALLRRQFLGLVEQPPQEGFVALFQFHHIGDVPLGDHQKMYRRLGLHIVESQDFIVLVDFPAGYFSLYNLAKDTVSHSHHSVFGNSLDK
jgi:hypothetical protein